MLAHAEKGSASAVARWKELEVDPRTAGAAGLATHDFPLFPEPSSTTATTVAVRFHAIGLAAGERLT